MMRNHLMRFERHELPDDATGQTYPVELVHQAFVELVPKRGREVSEANKMTGQTEYLIRTEWLDGLSSELVGMVGPRRFEIQAVINVDERSRDAEIHAIEVTHG